MTRRCCCKCFVFTDDFDRTDSTDVGSDWNEVVGDWEILDNELHEEAGLSTGTANAKIFGMQPVSAHAEGKMYVRVDLENAVVGDKYYVYVCCSTSSSVGTGVTVEFWMLATDRWQVSIIGAGAGGTGISGGPIGGVPISGDSFGSFGNEESTVIQSGDAADGVFVCADERIDTVTAGLINTVDEKAWVDDYDPGVGRYYAIGHDNADHGGTFDNFEVAELTSTAEECLTCVCACLDMGLKRTLLATITDTELVSGAGTGNSILPCDGQEFDLEFVFGGTYDEWHGTWINPLSSPVPFAIDMLLTCSGNGWNFPDHPGYNIVLAFADAIGSPLSLGPQCQLIGDSAGCSDVRPIALESSCDPMSLVYGWFYYELDIGPGQDISRYKITITNKPE